MDFLNASVAFANFVLIPGLSYGSQLALGALGVTLIYAVLRFANFAHGDTMAFGGMTAVFGTWWLQSRGVGLGVLPTALIVLPFSMLATICLALITDRLVYRHYRRKKAPLVSFVIASFGVMLTFNGLVRLMIGPGEQRFSDGERFIISAKEFRTLTGLQEGLAIKTTQGITIAVTLMLMAALFWFLTRTRTGKSMRAYSDNEDLALLSGISPDRVVAVCWIIAGGLAAIAGVLYGLDKIFKPFTYFQLLLPIFAAAVIGGMGNPLGAVIGGYFVAFSEIAITYAFRKVAVYLLPETWEPQGLLQLLSTDYKLAVSFAMLVAVLLIRPTGLFRGQSF